MLDRQEARHGVQEAVSAIGTGVGIDDDAVKPEGEMMRHPFHHKERLVAHAGDDHLFGSLLGGCVGVGHG